MIARLLIPILMVLAGSAGAQGFAGLGTAAGTAFATPDPDRALVFPRDHLPHPDYRIEWWYLTANMRGADGRAYGLQWTLFRSALRPERRAGWDSPQIWMGHAALSTPDAHFVAEKLARDGIGQAGVTGAPFAAWIDDWSMTGAGPGLDDLRLSAGGEGFAYDIRLVADGPLVPQGQGGYSVKSPAGQASHYYSQPFYRLEGTITLQGETIAVTGQGWLDREWSSQPLAEDQTGWDWFSLHLEGGAKLMGFLLRSRDGAPYAVGTWIAPDGTPTPLAPGAFRAESLAWSRVAGRDVPTRWRVRVDAVGVDVTVAALNPGTWMATLFSYWEGPVTVSGSHSGHGYLEMTGYAPDP